MMTIVLPHNT